MGSLAKWVIRVGVLGAAGMAGAAWGQSSMAEDARVECPSPDEAMADMIGEVQAERRRLDLQAQELDAREEDLVLAESTVASRLDEVARIREEAFTALAQIEEVEAQRLDALAERAAAMKTKAAGAMIKELFGREPVTAVAVLDRMDVSKAGKLLSTIDPQTAASIAARLVQPVELTP